MKSLIFSIILIFIIVIPVYAQTCANANSATCTDSASGATCTINFSSSQTAGDANAVSIQFCGDVTCNTDPSTETITVSDAQGNTYSGTPIVNTQSAGSGNVVRRATFVADNIGAHAAGNTVSFVVSGGHFSTVTDVAECSQGSPTFHDQANGGATVATSCTATTGNTLAANETVFAVGGPGSATSGHLDVSYTTITGSSLTEAGYKAVSSIGTQSATLTQTSTGVWCDVHVVTFKQGGGSSPSNPIVSGLRVLNLLGVGK